MHSGLSLTASPAHDAWVAAHVLHSGLGALVCLAALVLLAARLDERYLTRHVRRQPLLRGAAIGLFAVLAGLNALAMASPGLPPLVLLIDLATCAAPVALMFGALHLRGRKPAATAAHRCVLVVGAHPDDIELGCGATVARMADASHRVHAVVMSRGSNGGDSALREREAQRGGAFLEVTSVEVLDFPDTGLAAEVHAMTQEIERIVREQQPDLILTHSPNDQHQDHAAVHLATLRAARRHHSILCYESPSVTRGFNPSVFVDVAEYVDVKVAAVQLHRDQAGKPYMSADRVRGMAAFRGQQARLTHAEAFEPVRLLHSGIGALS